VGHFVLLYHARDFEHGSNSLESIPAKKVAVNADDNYSAEAV
jgi:hypothetical protein